MESPPPDIGPLVTERRRAGRVGLRLEARFSAGAWGTISCVVSDFSPEEGVLRLDALQSLTHLGDCTAGELTLTAEASEGHAHRCSVQVLRIEDRTLAVSLIDPTADVLALFEVPAPPARLTEAEIARRQQQFAAPYAALAAPAGTLVARGTARLATVFVARAEEALLAALRDARNNRDQQVLDAALTRLARTRSSIVRDAAELSAMAFAVLEDPLGMVDTDASSAGPGLSLVDLDEFEDYLSLSRVAEGLASACEEPLFELQRRLEWLARRSFTLDTLPLGPRVLCAIFAHALKGLADAPPAREQVFSALRDCLLAELAGFYAALNALLVEHGVLVTVTREKPTILRQQSRSGPPPLDGFGRAEPVRAPDPAATWPGALRGERNPRSPAHSGGTSTRPGYPLGALREQMQLSRLLAPAQTDSAEVPAYSTEELLVGLDSLRDLFSATQGRGALPPAELTRQLLESLAGRGSAGKTLGVEAREGLELVGNLFQSLLSDAALGTAARAQLPRLQPVLHRAALEDSALFDSTQHPLLRVVDRVAQLEATLSGEQEQRLQDILDRLARTSGRSPDAMDTVIGELEAVISHQGEAYAAAVAATVRDAEAQQAILRERRELAGEPPPPPPVFPEELARWVARARALVPGTRVTLNTTGQPVPLTLVWVAEGLAVYLFVDARGRKAASLTLQQVVIYLRRGLMQVVSEAPVSAVERAMFGVVERMHRQLVDDASEDPLTGIKTRKAFLREVEARLPLPQPDGTAVEGALCELSFENLRTLNDHHGTEVGDELIRALTREVTAALAGDDVVLGRLGGGEWGIYFTRGGEKAAHTRLRALLEKLGEVRASASLDAVPRLVCGIAGVDGQSPLLEPLLRATSAARVRAAQEGGEAIMLAGADERRRQQIVQLMSYVPKALTRERLVLMQQEVRALDASEMPAARLMVAALDRGGKLIPPTLFAPAVAATPHAFDTDLWSLRAVLRWMSEAPQEADRYSAFVLPLSRASVETDGIANLIVNEFMNYPVPPSRLRFELQDDVAHAKLPECLELVGSLREFGCRFVLGNFTGNQSDNTYLRELAVDYVELAGRFTVDRQQDPRDLAITRSINELAHFMGRRTIARVEASPEILRLLRQIRVDYIHDTTRETRLEVIADG